MRAAPLLWWLGLVRAAQFQNGTTSEAPFPKCILSKIDPNLCGTPVTDPTVITRTVIEDEATRTEIIISGGPITKPISLPTPGPTLLDPAGDEARQSVSDLSSSVAAALPAVTQWLDAPIPENATPAISAVEALISPGPT
ncbi:unnamed protein product, partial [Parascedosporium putredinis]